jgi:hypothetical protein
MKKIGLHVVRFLEHWEYRSPWSRNWSKCRSRYEKPFPRESRARRRGARAVSSSPSRIRIWTKDLTRPQARNSGRRAGIRHTASMQGGEPRSHGSRRAGHREAPSAMPQGRLLLCHMYSLGSNSKSIRNSAADRVGNLGPAVRDSADCSRLLGYNI